MASIPSPDIDDELFNEVYGKEYTGPPGTTATSGRDVGNSNKRPQGELDANAGSDGEDEFQDPNAVPTDFTSREAKVWVARAKATERNWKKRKEEELICKLCGESGHFTQGCPSTLGGNRRSSDFFQRVPARDKNVRALFTEKVIQGIERDNGCKIKMDEKFIIVSSKDQSSMTKGVDAVHKVIQDENAKGSSGSRRSRSRSPIGSPSRPQFRRSESQKSHYSPRGAPQPKFSKPERHVENHLREGLHNSSRSPQARAYGFDGARGKSSRSRSPPRSGHLADRYNSYNSYTQNVGLHITDGWDVERHGVNVNSGRRIEQSPFKQSLEELEMEFQREATELARIRDQEEDEENYRHREAMRQLLDSHMKKLAMLRGMHGKQWEDFLQLSVQQRQQAHSSLSTSSFNHYSHSSYPDYGRPGNSKYPGTSSAMDTRNRYHYPVENFPNSRVSHNSYGEFQHQRPDDFGKVYDRY